MGERNRNMKSPIFRDRIDSRESTVLPSVCLLCLCRFTARSWPSVSGLGTVARSGLQGARARLSGASGLSAVGTAWEEEGRATYVRSTRRKIPFWRASPCLSRGGGGAVVMRRGRGTPALQRPRPLSCIMLNLTQHPPLSVHRYLLASPP